MVIMYGSAEVDGPGWDREDRGGGSVFVSKQTLSSKTGGHTV